MGHLKNQKVVDLFAIRLNKFPATAELSPKQVAWRRVSGSYPVELIRSLSISMRRAGEGHIAADVAMQFDSCLN
jgi:hypothetical protein